MDNPPGGGQVVGKINADTTRNYYLKDHLGSIRVVLNSTNTIISAQDYDAWGYPLENRYYQSTNTIYKFTSKERDNETSYDYFGVRYYDSRIGRWGGVEPMYEKYLQYSPYVYVINNPIIFRDAFGKYVDFTGYNSDDTYDRFKNGTDLPLADKLGPNGRVSLKEGVKVNYNDLSEADKILYDAITREDKTVIIKSVKNPVFKNNDGKIYAVLGGTHGPEEGNSVTHFFNLESADYYDKAKVNSISDQIVHEVIEGQLRLNGMDQDAAHDLIIGRNVETPPIVPQYNDPKNNFYDEDGMTIIGFSYKNIGSPRIPQDVYSFETKSLKFGEWFPKK